MFFHFVFRSIIRTLATPNLGCISKIKMKKCFFILYFARLFVTLATPKVLTLDNKNEKSYSFTLYCPRLIVPLPQKIEKGHLCALTSSRFFLN